jgi:calcineurin-like phosphoesterase family protein
MSKIWFTSDTHFGHKNILKYANRPFASIGEMNETFILRWNERVAPEDTVYHLGDVSFMTGAKTSDLLWRLNGNIRVLVGNHDTDEVLKLPRFEWVKDYYELIVKDPDAYSGERLIVLFHYTMRVWNASHHGSWHLYGHSHGNLPDDPCALAFDAGVDSHNYAPISYEEVKAIMATKTWTPPFGLRGE